MPNHSIPPRVLSPAETARLVQEFPRVRVLDIRTASEYHTAHIPGSYHVPLDTLSEHAREICAQIEDPTILVCQSGHRAGKADHMLSQIGMTNLHILDGGMNAWMAARLPVRYGQKKISLERQVRIVAGSIAAAGGFLGALVHPAFGFISAFIGCGLVFAGLTDTCMLGMLLTRLPYNRQNSCNADAMVRSLIQGDGAT